MFDVILLTAFLAVSLFLIFKCFDLIGNALLLLIGSLYYSRSYVSHLLILVCIIFFIYLGVTYDSKICFGVAVFLFFAWLIVLLSFFVSRLDMSSKEVPEDTIKPSVVRDEYLTKNDTSKSSLFGPATFLLASALLLGRRHHHDEPPPPPCDIEHKEDSSEFHEEEQTNVDNSDYDCQDYDDYGDL